MGSCSQESSQVSSKVNSQVNSQESNQMTIDLLKEKEWDPWKRRSAATVESVSMDDMEVHL